MITDKFLLLSLKVKIAQLLFSDSIETSWEKMQNNLDFQNYFVKVYYLRF